MTPPAAIPRRRFHRLSTIPIALAVFTTACSPESPPSALGRWKSQDTKSTLHLNPDGTCDGTDEYGRHSQGTFKQLPDQRLQLSLEIRETNKQSGQILSDKSQGTLRMLVQPNSLVLTDENGAVSQFTRDQ